MSSSSSSSRATTETWRECWFSLAGGNSVFQCIGKILEGLWSVFPVSKLEMRFFRPVLDNTNQLSVFSMNYVRNLMATVGLHEASKDIGLSQPLEDWSRLYFKNENWAHILLTRLDERKNIPKPSIFLQVFWRILSRYDLNVSMALLCDTPHGLRISEKTSTQSAMHASTRYYCLVKTYGGVFTLLSNNGSVMIDESTFTTAMTVLDKENHQLTLKDEQMSCALSMLGLSGGGVSEVGRFSTAT